LIESYDAVRPLTLDERTVLPDPFAAYVAADGGDELETEIEGADTITLTHDLLPREREIVVAGGLIRYLREQQPTPA